MSVHKETSLKLSWEGVEDTEKLSEARIQQALEDAGVHGAYVGRAPGMLISSPPNFQVVLPPTSYQVADDVQYLLYQYMNHVSAGYLINKPALTNFPRLGLVIRIVHPDNIQHEAGPGDLITSSLKLSWDAPEEDAVGKALQKLFGIANKLLAPYPRKQVPTRDVSFPKGISVRVVLKKPLASRHQAVEGRLEIYVTSSPAPYREDLAGNYTDDGVIWSSLPQRTQGPLTTEEQEGIRRAISKLLEGPSHSPSPQDLAYAKAVGYKWSTGSVLTPEDLSGNYDDMLIGNTDFSHVWMWVPVKREPRRRGITALYIYQHPDESFEKAYTRTMQFVEAKKTLEEERQQKVRELAHRLKLEGPIPSGPELWED